MGKKETTLNGYSIAEYIVIKEFEVQTQDGPITISISNQSDHWSWIASIIEEYELRFKKLNEEVEELKAQQK